MRSNKSPFRFGWPFQECLFLVLIACEALLMTGLAQARNYKVLYSFTGPTNDGADPSAIIWKTNNTIYGTTCNGGFSYYGTVFSLSAEGKESILYNFDAGYGSCPSSLLAWHGDFYGATSFGGAYGAGAVFKLNEKGRETVLYNFPQPLGDFPVLSVVDANGVFYGSSFNGGANNWGSIFEVDSTGKFTVLYSFTNGTDGSEPNGGLVLDDKGNIYGTTYHGGDPNCVYPGGLCGTVFELGTNGHLTTLHMFEGGADGAAPIAGVTRDSSGNLYGTTNSGGDVNCLPPYGCGTVFVVDSSGGEEVLYSFAGLPNGVGPGGNLVRDASGNLYGTTSLGGDANCNAKAYVPGCGIVFKLDATGKETILHSFTSSPDGAFPTLMVEDAAGNLYGTTVEGGDAGCTEHYRSQGCGTIFRLTP